MDINLTPIDLLIASDSLPYEPSYPLDTQHVIDLLCEPYSLLDNDLAQ